MADRTTGGAYEVLAADYHRNGVGGEGYYVAVFSAPHGREPAPDLPVRYLMVVFPPIDDGGSVDFSKRWDRVAAIRVSDVESGNVFMFPHDGSFGTFPGGAALRAADYYQEVAKAAVRLQSEEADKKFREDLAAIKKNREAKR